MKIQKPYCSSIMGIKELITKAIYNPRTVGVSFKIYEISAGLGFAVMPQPPKEQLPLEKRIKNF